MSAPIVAAAGISVLAVFFHHHAIEADLARRAGRVQTQPEGELP